MAVSLSGWLVISNRCTDRREKWVSPGGGSKGHMRIDRRKTRYVDLSPGSRLTIHEGH